MATFVPLQQQYVQQQYEVLPYPHRDPARELEALRQPTLCELPRVQALVEGRPMDLDGFRVLDAGCGTGDNTVFLAEQLRGTGADVVALDFSAAALEVNRQRLAARGLSGVRHVLASIEEAPSLDLGEFDYIVSTGVLHHLASPEDGLSALRTLLRPRGVMGVMVYARYGREPVYLVQALMRHLAPEHLEPAQRLRILKRTVEGLPQSSRAVRGLLDAPHFRAEITQSDAGAYDLLLHTQDRPYTVPEVHAWLAGAGMRLREWSIPRHYDPSTYLAGVGVAHLGEHARQAAAELMHGGMTKHEFFAERDDAPERLLVSAADEGAVPVWCGWDFAAQVEPALQKVRPGQGFNCTFGPERMVAVAGDPVSRAFLRAVDGRKNVAEILSAAGHASPSLSPGQVRRRWVEFAEAFRAVAALTLYAPAD